MLVERIAELPLLRGCERQQQGEEVLFDAPSAASRLMIFVWPALAYVLYTWPSERGEQLFQCDVAVGFGSDHLRDGSACWLQCESEDEAVECIAELLDSISAL